jgi:hypothetical protein
MAYSKGIVTIPNVTGDIEIIVTTATAEIKPIELYSGNASLYKINYKYSGTSTTTANGRYLTDVVPVDFITRPYLNINGFYNGQSGAAPYIYKIGLYKGSTLSQVKYCGDFVTDKTKNQVSVDMTAYKDYDGIQFEIQPVSTAGTTLTEASVITSSQASIKLSTGALY